MMSRYVDAYMSLWRSPKPVIAQVHGFCVGGGTDFALCSDLIVCAEDCRIGYPPARVWGSPTTAMWIYRLGLERSKRLLLTGDPLDGRTRGRVGARVARRVPEAELDDAGARARRRASRSCPPTSSQMMKLLVNQAFEQMGLRDDAADRHAARRRRAPHAGGRRRSRGARWRTSARAVRRARRAVRRLRPGPAARCERRGDRPSASCSPAARRGGWAATRRRSRSPAGR